MPNLTQHVAVCAVAAVAWTCLVAPARAQTDSSASYHDPSFDHAAACVAAMKPRAAALADRFVDGDDTVRPELLRMTEASLAIVDDAVASGLTKAESEVLLASAQEFQKSVPEAKLERLVMACLAEGAALLDAATPGARERLRSQARDRVGQLRPKSSTN